MLPKKAIEEFKAIWRKQFSEDIPDETAIQEATNLLTMFRAIYRPINKEDVDK